MAYTDITGITGCILCWSRTGAGFTSTGDGTDITAWTDDSASGNDSTGAAVTTLPSHQDSPPGDLVGPCAEFSSENGHATGLDLGDTTWWIAFAWRTGTSLSGYQNLFSSQGGSGEGSLYTNAGVLTYEESGTTEATSTTLSTSTQYTIIFVSTSSGYELFVDNASVDTFATIGTPADQPSALEFHAYGGTGAGISGHISAYAIGSGTLSSGDRGTLHDALLEEAEGTAVVSGTVDETETAATDSITGNVEVDGIVAETETAATDTAAGNVEVDGIVAETESAATDTIAGNVPVDGIVAETESAATDTGSGSGSFADTFDGSGDLDGWAEIGAADAPKVSQASGRYLNDLDDNTADVTTWLDADSGRFDYRMISGDFVVTYRNIGCGTSPAATQTTPTYTTEDPYIFAGGMVNNDPASPTTGYVFAVAGYRGSTTLSGQGRTVETKTTISGSSSITHAGVNAIAETRADIRLTMTSGTLTGEYSEPGAESWTALTIPGTPPTWNSAVAVGIVCYAFGTDLVPFAGTCDGVEIQTSVDGVLAETESVATDSITGNVEVAGTASETETAAVDSITGNVEVAGVIAETAAIALDSITGTGAPTSDNGFGSRATITTEAANARATISADEANSRATITEAA